MKHTLQNLLTIFFIATGLFTAFNSQGQTINAFAGNDNQGYSGNGGQATQAELNGPAGITLDDTGNVYIADEFNNVIRKVSTTGIITTVAGAGGADAFYGDGGPATAAKLNTPTGVAVDGAGNIYIADYGNNRVRKVTATTGIITTIAGTGKAGFSGDLGQATAAELFNPFDVAVDTSGNIYISDFGNYRIRQVTVGIIVTIAGVGVQGFSGDNGPATAAKFASPEGITVDDSGNVYVADWGNNRIRKVSAATGNITTVAGNSGSQYSGDGGPAISSSLNNPTAVAVDASDNFYITDSRDYRVRRVSGGIIYTLAGDGSNGYSGNGGPATAAEISLTNGVCVDTGGNVYIADWGNNVVRKVNVCEIDLTLNPTQSTLCSGSAIPLTVSGGITYTWSPATGLSATTGDTVIASPSSNVTYTVTSSGTGTCSGHATVVLSVIPSPGKPNISQIGDTLISSSQHDNQWYRNDTLLMNDTSQDLIITSLGDYWVSTVNEVNGCATSSDTLVISGIRQLSAIGNNLSIYPNPFTDDVAIKINASAGNLRGWNMQVTDVLGRILYTKPSLNYNNDIDLSDLPNGIYFISVVNTAGKAVTPVLKQ